MRTSRLVVSLLTSLAPLAAQVAWTRHVVAPSPSARAEGGAAFDPISQRVLLQGGSGLGPIVGDTWRWDGTAWSAATPGPARMSFAMALHETLGRVVSFGGFDSVGTELQQTWQWTQFGWVQMFPAHSPGTRVNAAMCYDPVRGRLVLFGGMRTTPVLTMLADLWEFDGVDWLQRTFIGGPQGRTETMLAFDPVTKAALLYGGAVLSNRLDDTWTWDGNGWRRWFPTTPPHFQAAAMMVTDEVRARVMLFGGATPDPFAWEWDGGNWRQQFVPSPPTRMRGSVAWDPVHREVLLFGGFDGGSIYLGDTWTWRTVATASVTSFGSGCAGSAGTPSLANARYSLPWLGDTLGLRLSSLAATSPGAFFVTGLQSTPAVSLAPLGLPGCSSFVSLDSAMFAPAWETLPAWISFSVCRLNEENVV